MGKIKNWSLYGQSGTVWQHDHKNHAVAISGQPVNFEPPDYYQINAYGEGVFDRVVSKESTKKEARKRAVEYMRNHPGGVPKR